MLLSIVWIITLVTCLLCCLYVGLMAGYCYGWWRTKSLLPFREADISIAVIVAARNEESLIKACLRAILAQDYRREKIQILVVDDHSTDGTADIIKSIASNYNHVQLISLEGTGLSGKKAAIDVAIRKTDAELIVTTDADCVMGTSWLTALVSEYKGSGSKMIVGPVELTGSGVFAQMQQLEFMALSGSTAGALYWNSPILCNGANLAYTKEAYLSVNGFSGHSELASGDDVLLMYKVADKYPAGVRFLKSEKAIVSTPSKTSLGEFINQRKRWASKGFDVLNAPTKFVSLLVYFFCFFLLLLGLIAAFGSVKSTVYQPFLQICLILFGFKCIIDFLLLFLAASFFEKKRCLLLFLPEQFIYIIYVVVVGMLGNRGSYSWKGRKH